MPERMSFQSRELEEHDFTKTVPMRRELSLLIMQLLAENGCTETVHKLEQESGFYFNMKYFEQEVLNGNWDEVEKYLCGFTMVDDNEYSRKIFFEIRKQRYLEALDKHELKKAKEILNKDLKVFGSTNEVLFKELSQLLALNNFRENKEFCSFPDNKSAREALIVDFKKLIEENSLLCGKLQFPSLMNSRLRTLVNQSVNMQHQKCKHPNPHPMMKTLFVDHTCEQPNGAQNRDDKCSLISDPVRCRSLRLTGNSGTKIVRLVYRNSGVALLALASNAVHLLWKWHHSEQNPRGKATARDFPQLWLPCRDGRMSNELMNMNLEGAVHCCALTMTDKFVLSASGGMISLFSIVKFKAWKIFKLPPPPAATYFAFYPRDNNIIAIGMEDSTIQIFHVEKDVLIRTLKGHSKKVTGLAFSNLQDAILVSSDANAQICVWSMKEWEKLKSIILTMPEGHSRDSYTIVQFHRDQIHILVVHKTQIAIYDATELKCSIQRLCHPCEGNVTTITHATFSCDGLMVYAIFSDGTVCIFNSSNLHVRCVILRTSYLLPDVSAKVYPIVVAAHPSEPNQFAVGMTDGNVHVLEPEESEGRWWGVANQGGVREIDCSLKLRGSQIC